MRVSFVGWDWFGQLLFFLRLKEWAIFHLVVPAESVFKLSVHWPRPQSLVLSFFLFAATRESGSVSGLV